MAVEEEYPGEFAIEIVPPGMAPPAQTKQGRLWQLAELVTRTPAEQLEYETLREEAIQDVLTRMVAQEEARVRQAVYDAWWASPEQVAQRRRDHERESLRQAMHRRIDELFGVDDDDRRYA